MTTRRQRKGSAELTVVSDSAYQLVRRFDASAASVFRALTTPDLIERWWGYEGSEWVECVADVRPGGYWRNAVTYRGQEVHFHGWYVEVEPLRRLVHTEVYEGLPGVDRDSREPSVLITTTLTEEGGVATLHVHVERHTAETLKAMLETGMEDGIQVTYDRLEDVLLADAA